jgi:ATP-dependent DNA ligase
MLGRVVRAIPDGDYLFEPKWDGFRCVTFRDGSGIDMRSRHDRPLARYFPEVRAALAELREERFVLDGELVLAPGAPFADLLARLHPAASRVELLARETPAEYVVFDLLAQGDEDLRELPFERRRALLEELLVDAPARVRLGLQTRDTAQAREWLEGPPIGIDGVMAKAPGAVYEPGARRMLKVKLDRTADCVVGGFRIHERPQLAVSSLLLGLYDDEERLQHVGVASSFGRARGIQLLDDVRDLARPLEGHPWEHGMLVEGGATGRLPGAAARWTPDMQLDWVPVEPVKVAEIGYDHADGARFRHPGRFRRWRDDRTPESCRVDQLPAP